ncbi:MAG: hypothetical protein ACLRWM_02925 [Streptococcus sp.]
MYAQIIPESQASEYFGIFDIFGKEPHLWNFINGVTIKLQIIKNTGCGDCMYVGAHWWHYFQV